jgi:protocatechuate 3,4-dioxygenase beta subunit
MTSRSPNLPTPQRPGYRKPDPGTQPDYLFPPYASTAKRSPSQPLVLLPSSLSETTGPLFGRELIKVDDHDLTKQGNGAPIGERIVVSGRVLDANARPVANTLVEIWQANGAGRYPHKRDNHNAPLDPNFTGCGRTLTDADGHYRFISIRPGEYPWRNHYNAWRPAHIHFSLFGPAFVTRLVTQMYFPGDPLQDFDPMYQSIPDERARRRLVSAFDWETTIPEQALGYKFDIVLRGRDETPMENYLPGGGRPT